MTSEEYCQRKAADSGSSFYYSFLFLPANRRRAITALYAFCREVDDIVDECPDPTVAATKLIAWQQEIERLYSGNPQHPISLALQPVLKEFDLPRELLLEIIEGMAMDLKQTQYKNFAALSLYCYRVASVVGLLASEIFGATHPDTKHYARDLGMAFQLTNIARDVGEDARLGRIYLPLDELQRFEVPLSDIFELRYSGNFRALMEFQVQRAEQFYKQAFEKLPAIDRKTQKPGLIMAAIYRALLDEIKQDGYRVLNKKTSLASARKLWIAITTWIKD